MQRVAWLSRLNPGAEEAYDQAHAAVWPEMLAVLKRAGIAEFSIFRRGQLLFLAMQVEDFDAAWATVEADLVNTRWQETMKPFLAPAEPLQPGERFPIMQEVFYLP